MSFPQLGLEPEGVRPTVSFVESITAVLVLFKLLESVFFPLLSHDEKKSKDAAVKIHRLFLRNVYFLGPNAASNFAFIPFDAVVL